MKRRIPPLNPLRVFEVVARTENLTAAAHELHVTQSAVSRQIAVLEEYLGLELFRRERHGVTLTRAGRSYADSIIPAFADIAAATERLTGKSTPDALRIRMYTTFAAKWMIPRLMTFRDRHPDIDVRISNAVDVVDFDRDPADMAILFGDGNWPRMQVDYLFGDEIEPVCSPRFLAQHAPNAKYPESLLRQRLLVSHYRRTDWEQWLSAAGLQAEAANSERMSFGSSVLTWQAAADGLGVAIGQNALLTDEFASGRLVRPFARPHRGDKAYYLVRPSLQREERKVRLFRDWLLATCAQMNSSAS